MRKIIVSLLLLSSIQVYAVVTVLDPATAENIRQSTGTMAKYTSQVAQTIQKMSAAKSGVDQLKNLKGLQKLQAAEGLCNLCTATDQQKLADYSNSINDDLCSQFGYAYKNITGISKSFDSLQDVMKAFSDDPRSAALSLQQASVSAQQTTNTTLAQMQLMQSQMVQKQLAEEKLMKTTGEGMAKSIQTSPF